MAPSGQKESLQCAKINPLLVSENSTVSSQYVFGKDNKPVMRQKNKNKNKCMWN